MKKTTRLYVLHILECIDKIDMICTKGDIAEENILYDAVLRNLQTMSEATRHLPETKMQEYPEIPWSDISGFRNILVHDYLGTIDAATITDVIQQHLPALKKVVQDMLDQLDKKGL